MLKQLKLHAELKRFKNELDELTSKRSAFEVRSAELTTALDEAKTDEELDLVSRSAEVLETEIAAEGIDEKIPKLESEVLRIEGELDELSKRAAGEISQITTQKNEGERSVSMNRYQMREALKTGQYHERAEVKAFYEGFKKLRAVDGEGLLIPQIIIDHIMDIVGDYCTMYSLVDKITAHGTARILIDTDTTAATWIEQNEAIPQGDVGTITSVDFDGYKIGKVTFVDNYMLQDSIINLDAYVVKKIARAIALGLDKAILNGEGSTKKQPEGIITKLPDTHKVAVTAPKGYVDIVKHVALIDSGEDSVGEIVAVVKRATYYNRLLGFSVLPTAKGTMAAKLPNLSQPDLLGLRVVFNNNMADDTILFGDFSQYTLVERENIIVDRSEHVKFAEDKLGFRGKARFDGKPTKPTAFVLVTINDA